MKHRLLALLLAACTLLCLVLTSCSKSTEDVYKRQVANDILYISEIIGCKLAIADHRCSHPTRDELIRLVSDIRMASLVSGKVGELHLHVGASPEGLSLIHIFTGYTAHACDYYQVTADLDING